MTSRVSSVRVVEESNVQAEDIFKLNTFQETSLTMRLERVEQIDSSSITDTLIIFLRHIRFGLLYSYIYNPIHNTVITINDNEFVQYLNSNKFVK